MAWYRSLLLRGHPTLRELPGPEPAFPLRSLGELAQRSAWEVTMEMHRRHGPYALLWIVNQPVVLVHDPAAIRQILDTRRDAFVKHEPLSAMLPGTTRNNPFVVNGSEWDR